MPTKRILLAGLFHETNTFAPGFMGLDQFSTRLGAAILAGKGDGSPIGAFLEAAEEYGWEVLPTVDYRATPGARPTAEVFDTFWAEWEKAVQGDAVVAAPVDAIFLVLHGAMAAENSTDVEGELLARIRQNPRFAKVPLFGVLDLHANFSPAMAEHSNGLVVYRKNPHTDAAETAKIASALLQQHLSEGGTPWKTRFVPTDILWPAPGTATAARPMATLEAIAREAERDGIAAVNVYAGFAHADTPHTGVSFSIVHDPSKVAPERLDALADTLRKTAEAEKALGLPDEWNLDAAIEDAVAKGDFPCCLVEPADNVGGGGPADGTMILRALLRHKESGGVVLSDPESVAALQGAEPGSEHVLHVGGKTFPTDPGPVEVRATLVRLTDGCYTLEDRHSHAASMSGIHLNMGPCAVVQVEGVTILLTSKRAAPMDLGQWRSQGIEPASLRFIGVKAAVAHRQAYDKIARAQYWVSTIGPCASDLRTLPYKEVRRPVFPLDNI